MPATAVAEATEVAVATGAIKTSKATNATNAADAAGAAEAIDTRVLQQAAEWFAVLGSPTAGAADRRGWQDWCDADVRHREAWRRVEAISAAFGRLPTADPVGARRVLDAASLRQVSRRRAARMLVALGGAGALAWAVVERDRWAPWQGEHRTATGERREFALADGGRVWLNTDSAIDIDYTRDWRRIRLHRGEILIRTAGDADPAPRPFVVDTAEGRIRALGTRFSVHQQDGATRVNVFEGRVELRPRRSEAAPGLVATGQQGVMTAADTLPLAPAEAARQAWSRGLLLAENVRLADVLADLSRHRPGYLGCTAAVADLRLVGAYDLADTDRVLAALEATLPVRVRRILPWWIVVDARQGA